MPKDNENKADAPAPKAGAQNQPGAAPAARPGPAGSAPPPGAPAPAASPPADDPEAPRRENQQRAERETFQGYPRTSGTPEIFAVEEVPSQKADKEAALSHADRGVQSRMRRAAAGIPQPAENPPEQMHSMTRREMQVHGISDEALETADELNVDRYDLLDNEGTVTAIQDFQDDLHATVITGEPGGEVSEQHKQLMTREGQREVAKAARTLNLDRTRVGPSPRAAAAVQRLVEQLDAAKPEPAPQPAPTPRP